MPFKSIRVIVADDHPMIRNGIRATLAAHREIQIAAEVEHFEGLLDLLEVSAAHVLVLDQVGMGGGPLSMVDRLRRDYPRLAIVVYSSSLELAVDLIAAGVLGYVLKHDPPELLARAIVGAARGASVISPLAVAHIQRTEQLHRQIQLTLREQAVLRLLSKGYRTDEIAERLCIEQRTVQNYISALLQKTGLQQRAALVDWYRSVLHDQLDILR